MARLRILIVTSDFECGNGKNVIQLAPMHYEFNVGGDKPTYCHYFMVKVMSEGEEGELRLDVYPDPEMAGLGGVVDFSQHIPSLLWVRHGDGRWLRMGVNSFEAKAERITIRHFIKRDETLYFAKAHPFPYSEMTKFLTNLAETKPKVCRLLSIGNSFEGRPIHCLRVSDPQSTDVKERVLVLAGQHAIEFPGVWAAAGIAEYLTSAVPKAMELRKRYVFDVIPMINPDGNIHGLNGFNAEGVDLYQSFEGCAKGKEATAHESRLLWNWVTEDMVRLVLHFHCYAHPRPWGDPPYEGLYAVPIEVFKDEKARERQRMINDSLRFFTHGFSQHRNFIWHQPSDLSYQLALGNGVLSAFYECQGEEGPHRNMLTGVRVLDVLMSAYEQSSLLVGGGVK